MKWYVVAALSPVSVTLCDVPIVPSYADALYDIERP
jgi:hypothetical protein